MSDFTLIPLAEYVARPPIEMRLDRNGTSGYTAIVLLCGEHDLATASDVEQALRPIWGNVLVDLTDCEFIDSSVIGVLIRDHQDRTREGQRLELLVPETNTTIARTLQIAGVQEMLNIHAGGSSESRRFA